MARFMIASKRANLPKEVKQATTAASAPKPKKAAQATAAAKSIDQKGTSNKRARARSPSNTPTSADDPDSTLSSEQSLLDKQLVLAIIVAKLEASKECDWHALSQKIAASYKTGSSGGGKKGGSKGKNGKAEEGEGKINGTELYELYHTEILPALKHDKALWIADYDTRTDNNALLLAPQTSLPVSVKDETVNKNANKDSVEREEEEEDAGGQEEEDVAEEEGQGEIDYEEESQVIKKPRIDLSKSSGPSIPFKPTSAGSGGGGRSDGSGKTGTGTGGKAATSSGSSKGRGGVKTYQKKGRARTSSTKSRNAQSGSESENEIESDESLYTP
ncbi:hypothetical protein IAT40_007090 [Kwoniella sp. CBS 6097]